MAVSDTVGGSILAQNIEITKFFFIKTVLLKKGKIITFFVKFDDDDKLLHKSFVS